MRRLLLSLILLLPAFGNAQTPLAPEPHTVKKIALDIVIADDIAIQTDSPEILRKMFADNLPDTEFRTVIVHARTLMLPENPQLTQKTREELIQKLQSVLNPGDVLTHLILDTHGDTLKKDGEVKTWLYIFGEISATGVDDNIRSAFAALKDHTSPDARVILNACSVFQGDEAEASQRAQTFLNFLNAPNGAIYGSSVEEVDTNAFLGKYGGLKYMLPSKTLMMIQSGIGLALGTTMAIQSYHQQDGQVLWNFGLGFGLAQSLSLFRPLLGKLWENMKLVNVGYIFEFKKISV